MNIKPSYRIVANSQDITSAIRDRFVSLDMTDESGIASDTLTITLSDHDPNNKIQLPPTGAELELWLGYDDQTQRVGMFVVDEIDLVGPPDQLIIGAKASPNEKTPAGKTSMTTQKWRSWEAGTLFGDLVKTVAEDHNLEPAVTDALAVIELPHLDQVGESDMNLVTRVARTYDAIAKPAGGKLVVAPRSASTTVSGSAPLPTVALTPGDVSTWSVKISKRQAFQSVTAVWRDQDAAQDVKVTAGTGEPVRILRHQYANQAEAEQAAKGELSKAGRGESKLSITMPGRTDLMADGRLVLSRFRPGVNGEWLITQVSHRVTKNGYSCSVSAEVPKD